MFCNLQCLALALHVYFLTKIKIIPIFTPRSSFMISDREYHSNKAFILLNLTRQLSDYNVETRSTMLKPHENDPILQTLNTDLS